MQPAVVAYEKRELTGRIARICLCDIEYALCVFEEIIHLEDLSAGSGRVRAGYCEYLIAPLANLSRSRTV